MDNNNKLISKLKLELLTYEWLKPFIDKCEDLGGDRNHFSSLNVFEWELCSSVRKCGIGACLGENQWVIYNDTCDKYANIKIFDDHIEFDEDSEFIEFTRDEMYSLYKFLKERIFDIKFYFTEIEKNEDENVKNNKLISQEDLCSLVGEHILPIISHHGGVLISGDDGTFIQCDNVDFVWFLRNSVKVWKYAGFARLIDDHWAIYTDRYNKENLNVNIKIYKDHIEFNNNSKFEDFDKEYMYGLYEKIKEYVEGNKEENK